MLRNRRPIGQLTEVTSPYIAIVGAVGITILAVLAFGFWPNTDTLHTGATGNLPEAEKTVPTSPSPKNQ